MPIQSTTSVTFDMARYPSKPVADLTQVQVEGRQIQKSSGNVVPVTPGEQGPALKHEELSASVSRLNDHARSISRDLKFTIDEELDRVIVRVYNSETEELIRQIPSEEVLAMARYLAKEEGVILDTEA